MKYKNESNKQNNKNDIHTDRSGKSIYNTYIDHRLTHQQSGADEKKDIEEEEYLIDSEELERLDTEYRDRYCSEYIYPIPILPLPQKQTTEEYGPYGSQWYHDYQVDDIYDNQLEKRAIIYKKLREMPYIEQRSDEWFRLREGAITASDGGCVLGHNHYSPQYTFLLKKTVGIPFESNKYCYHGKKMEEIATMMYEYRMNVSVEEFGLMIHPKYSFIGASPDGICSDVKLNMKHKSQFVGRMLEIKCPFGRKIKMSGPIKDHICPLHYWIQVQLQLECCDLEECDFWQVDLREYNSREEFIADTDPREQFRSTSFGFEKGCLIQLLPKDKLEKAFGPHGTKSGQRRPQVNPSTKWGRCTHGNDYDSVIFGDAIFIYPPKIVMSPPECDAWIADVLSTYPNVKKCKEHCDKKCREEEHDKFTDYIFDKVLYWRAERSKNVIIVRDKEWFRKKFPVFKQHWQYVLFLRSNKRYCKLFVMYIDSMPKKYNKKIMATMENLYRHRSKFIPQLKDLIRDNRKTKRKAELIKKQKKVVNDDMLCESLFVD